MLCEASRNSALLSFRSRTINGILAFQNEYRTMESIAKEYEVSLDTIADNIHWVERTLLNADILQTSVTCVYKTN